LRCGGDPTIQYTWPSAIQRKGVIKILQEGAAR
jgi:hypothetical protein